MALGEPVVPDYRALPRATYTDPEAAFVGLTLEQAQAAGLDAFECVADFATRAKGYSRRGHARPRDDRRRPRHAASSSARRWPARTPRPRSTSASWRSGRASRSSVLADTIHAFPSTSRIFNGLFAEALRELRLADGWPRTDRARRSRARVRRDAPDQASCTTCRP